MINPWSWKEGPPISFCLLLFPSPVSYLSFPSASHWLDPYRRLRAKELEWCNEQRSASQDDRAGWGGWKEHLECWCWRCLAHGELILSWGCLFIVEEGKQNMPLKSLRCRYRYCFSVHSYFPKIVKYYDREMSPYILRASLGLWLADLSHSLSVPSISVLRKLLP